MRGNFVITQSDWSLHRQAHEDQRRHKERVKEALRQNLRELITEESIVLSDGKSIVKVPVRTLDEVRLRFDFNKQRHVGSGGGGSAPGDPVGDADSSQGPGGAGDAPGADVYEAEVDVDDLSRLLFEELSLPNLEPKGTPNLKQSDVEFTDIRRVGISGNLDKKRTLLAAIKRRALDGRGDPWAISPDDLRYKTWEDRPRPVSNAIILAMMDTSGSMDTTEKYIARTFYYWMLRFLRSRYQDVEIVYIAHDTRAKEVSEEAFFAKGESGGTRCSSAYDLALQIVDQRYPADQNNIYPFHFTDGDNFPSDNERCIALARELVRRSALMGYGEIATSRFPRENTLIHSFREIDDSAFRTVVVKEKAGVYDALRAFFAANPHRAA